MTLDELDDDSLLLVDWLLQLGLLDVEQDGDEEDEEDGVLEDDRLESVVQEDDDSWL